MTYEQILDLAELEADLAHEKFLEAFERNEHPEILEQLNIEAMIARHRYDETNEVDLAH